VIVIDCPILCRHMNDAVGVDVECDLDLRHTARCGRKVDELELAERLVELRHLALALQHVDLDRRLVVLGCREHLGTARGDGGVALDELGHDAALGLDAEGQRRDVQQEDVLDVALEHAGLDGRTDRDDLVGVDTLVGIVPRHLLDEADNRGHAGRTAHQHDVFDVALGETGVLDGLFERGPATLEQIGRELLELGPGELFVEVQRALGRGGDEGQVDLRLLHL
jgi:hypothetical protein